MLFSSQPPLFHKLSLPISGSRHWQFLLLLAMVLLGSAVAPRRAWAQTAPISLGAAAQFGLLAHDALLATDSVTVIGAAGAGSISPTIRATSGVMSRPVHPTVGTALADLAQAKTVCAARQPQIALPTDTLSGLALAPGTYSLSGNAILRGGAPLRLTGDSSSVYVFNVSGELRASNNALVITGRVAAANIYWNVAGIVRLGHSVGVSGIILGGDSIVKVGVKAGNLAMLTTGAAISMTGLHSSIGSNQFHSASTMATWAGIPPTCLPVPAFTGNLIANASFEQKLRCPVRFSENMQQPNSDLCGWNSPAIGPFAGTPDYYHTCATTPLLQPTQGIFGPQVPRTGNGMTGLYAEIYDPNDPIHQAFNSREYIQAELVRPLQAGRTYYAEFHWSFGERSAYAAPALGMWFGNTTQEPDFVNSSYLYQLNGQDIQPQVESDLSLAPLDDAVNWSKVANLFTVPTSGQLPLDMVTVGNFQNDLNWSGGGGFPTGVTFYGIYGAYYFIDDLMLWELPAQPANATLSLCDGATTTLGAPLPPTPPGLSVTYTWAGPGIGIISGTTLSQITVSQPGQYGFSVRVNGKTYTYAPITVTGNAANVTLTDTVYVGGYTFHAGKTYFIPQNTRFLDGSYTLEPDSRLLLGAGVSVRLGPDALLDGGKATIGAACGAMWGGILNQAASLGVSLYSVEMTQSTQGIVLRHANQPLQLEECRFRDNLIGIEILPTAATGQGRISMIGGYIRNCTFSTTGGFLPPYKSTKWGQAQINLGNWDVSGWTISGNDIGGALAGIYGGARKKYGLSAKPGVGATITSNTFRDCPVGGIIGLEEFAGEVSDNTFVVAEAYPAAITSFLIDYQIPGALYNQPVGFYGSLAGATLSGNRFSSTRTTVSFPSLATSLYGSPTGMWLSVAGYPHPKGIVRNNSFTRLQGAGIQMLPSDNLVLTGNDFTDCRFYIRVNATSNITSGNQYSFPVSCNTFTRTGNARGPSAGIYVVNGANVEFALRDITGALVSGTAGTPGDIMKNLFVGTGTGGTFWHIYNEQNNPYPLTYKTFMAGTTQTTHAANVVAFNVGVPQGRPFVPRFQTQFSCAAEDGFSNGIQTRSTNSPTPVTPNVGLLGTPTPNPTSGEALINYGLPLGCSSGELLIRESVQGTVVYQAAVSAEREHATLLLGHLRPGLYLISLVVKERSVGTVRLQITR